FARIWPLGAPAPAATFVNYTKGQSTTNTGAVPIGTGGQVSLRNFGGPSDFTVDIQGYFVEVSDLPTGATGSRYHALVPCRILDTRTAAGVFTPNRTLNQQVTGPCGVIPAASAVEASVSATES